MSRLSWHTLAEEQDRSPVHEANLRRAEASLRARWAQGSPARQRWPFAVGGLALAATAVALTFGLRAPKALRFELGAASSAGVVGVAIRAEGAAGTPLRFSDGSTVLVEPGGVARVLATTARGADVALERGGAYVSVSERGGSERWSVSAGPFRVEVAGTSFRLRFSPEARSLDLETFEGQVVVEASCARADGGTGKTAVGAGQTLRTWCLAPTPDIEPLPSSAEPATGRPKSRPAVRRLPASPAPERAATPSSDDPLTRGSAGEILRLAQAARLNREDDAAVRAYEALRARFPGTEAAATAAFALGRMSVERDGYRGRGRAWFERYLAERPAGAFADEATGRLMEILANTGELPRARALARAYLGTRPDGAYRALAEKLASGDTRER